MDKAYDFYAPDTPSMGVDPAEQMMMSLGKAVTPLSRLFFGWRNIDYLQEQLSESVQRELGYRISRQNADQILVVMRWVWGSYSENDGGQEEVDRLNRIFLAEAVPIVITNIKSYLVYVKHASELPTPINRPVYVSSKGGDRTAREWPGNVSGRES
jgi:hypothetical protein